jgi:hypothetical protein
VFLPATADDNSVTELGAICTRHAKLGDVIHNSEVSDCPAAKELATDPKGGGSTEDDEERSGQGGHIANMRCVDFE